MLIKFPGVNRVGYRWETVLGYRKPLPTNTDTPRQDVKEHKTMGFNELNSCCASALWILVNSFPVFVLQNSNDVFKFEVCGE